MTNENVYDRTVIIKTSTIKKSSFIISKKYETPKSPPITEEERTENLKTIIEHMKNNKRLLNKFKNLFP